MPHKIGVDAIKLIGIGCYLRIIAQKIDIKVK